MKPSTSKPKTKSPSRSSTSRNLTYLHENSSRNYSPISGTKAVSCRSFVILYSFSSRAVTKPKLTCTSLQNSVPERTCSSLLKKWNIWMRKSPHVSFNKWLLEWGTCTPWELFTGILNPRMWWYFIGYARFHTTSPRRKCKRSKLSILDSPITWVPSPAWPQTVII